MRVFHRRWALLVAGVLLLSSLGATASHAAAATGTVIVHIDEATGTYASGLCVAPGVPQLASFVCAVTGDAATVDTALPAGSSLALILPAGTYNGALAPMTLAVLGPVGQIVVAAGQTVECSFTTSAAPSCAPAAPQTATVVLTVDETATATFAVGLCLAPGQPVLFQLTCSGTGAPAVTELNLPPGGSVALPIWPGTYNAALARTSPTPALGTIGSVTAAAGQTLRCSFSLAAGPTCVPDDGDQIAEPAGVDGNGDGTPDDAQAEVATFAPAAGGGPITLAAPAGGYVLTDITTAPTPTDPPPPTSVQLPFGIVGFSVTLPPGATTADVEVILPPGAAPTSYWKLVGGAWVDISEQTTIVGDVVTLHLVDGDPLDTDPAVGVIGDPGAAGVAPITGSFSSPVDGEPIVNIGKAGRTYPVRFVLERSGWVMGDLAAVSALRVRSLSCSTLTSTGSDALEAETSGSSTLRVGPDGTFTANWSTPTVPGCYQLVVALADGGELRATFDLR